MDTATQEIYFQKVQEFVFDDDKIITVCFLAAELNISVSDAKNIIKKFVEDIRQLKPQDLAVTYILTGILKDSENKGVFIVKETDLESKRDLFKQVLSEVLYSVQKSKNIDFNIISLVDTYKDIKLNNIALPGLIVSKNCVKRVLKRKKLPSPVKASTAGGKSSFFTKFTTKATDATNSTTKQADSNKQQPQLKSTNSIVNLFNNAPAKVANQNGTKDQVKKTKNIPAKSSNLSEFLVKGAAPVVKPSSKNESSSEEKIEEDEVQMDDISMLQILEPQIELVTDVKVIRKRSRKGYKNSAEPLKKRRRIIEEHNSDSDDIFEEDNNDVEDVIEKSDEEPEPKPTMPVKTLPLAPKNKKRKAIERLYEDEDGFTETITEFVYETASEDENEEPVRKISPKLIEKKISSNSENDASIPLKGNNKKKGKKGPTGKQPTLMNFFQKK